jgi:hypothetical protein
MTTFTPPDPKLEIVRPAASTPSWSGMAAGVFSFPVMCMFLLAVVIFKGTGGNVADPDIWWHLRNGQQMVLQHTFPRVDTYSFGAAGSAWLAYEWLSEIQFFLVVKSMGLQGLLAVYLALLGLIFTGVYYRSCRAGADCKNAAVATSLAISLGGVSIAPRTLLFGWLCMVGLLILLDRLQRTGKGLWLLAPLFGLWINLHGSWVFGMVVLVMTITSGLVEGEWGLVVARRWTPVQLRKLVVALAGSVAALFANPFGYRLVLYPFDVLFRQRGLVKYIEEWQPVDFNTVNGRLALITIFALLAAALFSRRQWRLDEVILMAFALWTALSHVRFLFFAGLIAAPILAPRLKLFPPYEQEKDKPWLNAAIMAGVVGLLILFFPSPTKMQQKLSEKYPTAALEFIQRQHINGRIFNNDHWGGYIEWSAPELKPFTDSRGDIFVYNGAFDDYIKAVSIQGPLEILDKHKIDYVLLQPARPLAYLLEHSPAWHRIYSDKVAVLFERATPLPAQSK